MGTKSHKIVAQLKQQAVFPICSAALEEWKRRTRFKTCEVAILNRTNGEKIKAWIDNRLFKRAIFNLMEIAAQTCGKRDGLSFSIVPGWQGSTRIIIGYPKTMKRTNEDDDDTKAGPDGETIEIVSQHRGKIEITEEKHRGMFLIHLPH